LTIKQIAKALKVSERTVNTWIQRGCPRGPLSAVKTWHQQQVLPRLGGPRKKDEGQRTKDKTHRDASSAGITLQERVNLANARKAEEDARYKQLKADELEGKTWRREKVTREAAEIFTEIRAILESIPDAAAKEVPQQFQTRVYDVERNKIAAALKKLAGLHTVGSRADDDDL
jgi:phage terminase Nu1 subunit (DNA packaging protein)